MPRARTNGRVAGSNRSLRQVHRPQQPPRQQFVIGAMIVRPGEYRPGPRDGAGAPVFGRRGARGYDNPGAGGQARDFLRRQGTRSDGNVRQVQPTVLPRPTVAEKLPRRLGRGLGVRRALTGPSTVRNAIGDVSRLATFDLAELDRYVSGFLGHLLPPPNSSGAQQRSAALGGQHVAQNRLIRPSVYGHAYPFHDEVL